MFVFFPFSYHFFFLIRYFILFFYFGRVSGVALGHFGASSSRCARAVATWFFTRASSPGSGPISSGPCPRAGPPLRFCPLLGWLASSPRLQPRSAAHHPRPRSCPRTYPRTASLRPCVLLVVALRADSDPGVGISGLVASGQSAMVRHLARATGAGSLSKYVPASFDPERQ